MLVRLYGSNFRSLKNDFELSLVAADFTRDDDRNRGVIEVPLDGAREPLRILRTAAIYGSNASGKSTVLSAGRALRWLGTASSQNSQPDSKIPAYEPFLLNEQSRCSPIKLGCDVIHNNSLLRYEIEYFANHIQTEQLVSLDADGPTPLIDRHSSDSIEGDLIKQSKANRLYVKGMQPNVSVLSKLAQHGPQRGPDSARPFFKSIRDSLRHKDYAPVAALQMVAGPASERFADDEKYRAWIMQHLMCEADVGICDVRTSRETVDLPDHFREFMSKMNTSANDFRFPNETIDVSFVHSGTNSEAIDFSDESSGTKKLFNIADDWWKLANARVTLLADELGASLHPRLLDRLVRAVNDATGTSKHSQLVFTTHETGLLESQDGLPPALRRDQVYFTRKTRLGESELYSLAEFKDDARPVHNIRKRYLSGLYGGVPSVEGISLE